MRNNLLSSHFLKCCPCKTNSEAIFFNKGYLDPLSSPFPNQILWLWHGIKNFAWTSPASQSYDVLCILVKICYQSVVFLENRPWWGRDFGNTQFLLLNYLMDLTEWPCFKNTDYTVKVWQKIILWQKFHLMFQSFFFFFRIFDQETWRFLKTIGSSLIHIRREK